MFNFLIVKIDSDYCDYLREFDDKVAYNKNSKDIDHLWAYYLISKS